MAETWAGLPAQRKTGQRAWDLAAAQVWESSKLAQSSKGGIHQGIEERICEASRKVKGGRNAGCPLHPRKEQMGTFSEANISYHLPMVMASLRKKAQTAVSQLCASAQ